MDKGYFGECCRGKLGQLSSQGVRSLPSGGPEDRNRQGFKDAGTQWEQKAGRSCGGSEVVRVRALSLNHEYERSLFFIVWAHLVVFEPCVVASIFDSSSISHKHKQLDHWFFIFLFHNSLSQSGNLFWNLLLPCQSTTSSSETQKLNRESSQHFNNSRQNIQNLFLGCKRQRAVKGSVFLGSETKDYLKSTEKNSQFYNGWFFFPHHTIMNCLLCTHPIIAIHVRLSLSWREVLVVTPKAFPVAGAVLKGNKAEASGSDFASTQLLQDDSEIEPKIPLQELAIVYFKGYSEKFWGIKLWRGDSQLVTLVLESCGMTSMYPIEIEITTAE
ncbi:hypothetical protein VP01_195g2 [Puccinia sorghi]|uniref:Uncharacterized protein n=1 Tax=Puccinia sorghi TaxID=27349 RepID=A0A0L6VBX8_9BASI|nr:hypothetical protein VP01_195g2 [Puccinia sorghi]